MLESIIIILFFMNEFLSLIFASDRLTMYQMISLRENTDEFTKKEKRVLITTLIRFLTGFIYLAFLIYGLFVPHLFLYCLLTLILSAITGFITHQLAKMGNSLKKRIWISRIDSLLTLLIWLQPVLKIVKAVF